MVGVWGLVEEGSAAHGAGGVLLIIAVGSCEPQFKAGRAHYVVAGELERDIDILIFDRFWGLVVVEEWVFADVADLGMFG